MTLSWKNILYHRISASDLQQMAKFHKPSFIEYRDWSTWTCCLLCLPAFLLHSCAATAVKCRLFLVKRVTVIAWSITFLHCVSKKTSGENWCGRLAVSADVLWRGITAAASRDQRHEERNKKEHRVASCLFLNVHKRDLVFEFILNYEHVSQVSL